MVLYRIDFGTLRRAWIDVPVRSSSEYDPIWGRSYIKGGQLFPQTKKGAGGEEEVRLKREIEMTRRISGSVTLCNRWVVGIHLPRGGEQENTLRGLQWDFGNYLLPHIWIRWLMRGLEAWTALPPSENYRQGDFKNIPLMLQDKSLITGNYGPPTLTLPPPQQPPQPPFFFCLCGRPSASTLSLLLSSHSTGGASCRGIRGKGGGVRGLRLLPGRRQWSWPLTLYCTSIHVEWLTCG